MAGPEADGLVILAEIQTAGRGRMGRTWTSPRGASILCSVALIDSSRTLEPGPLALLLPIAVADAIRAETGVRPQIRWPNDLMVDGRKIGGILVESRAVETGARAYVCGIGINCLQQPGHFPPELAERAASLEILSSRPVDRTALVRELLQQLDRWLGYPDHWTLADVRRDWLDRSELIGGRVRLRCDGKEFEGWMVDIDPQAALVLRLTNGVVRHFPISSSTLMDVRSSPDTMECRAPG